jgi:hypothetical protein
MIRAFLIGIFRWFRFNIFKARAIASWKVTGKRHWILPIIGTGKMVLMNSDSIAAYNKRAKRHNLHKIDLPFLMKNALYGTPVGRTGDRRRRG